VVKPRKDPSPERLDELRGQIQNSLPSRRLEALALNPPRQVNSAVFVETVNESGIALREDVNPTH
jgi:hypothetical protein